MTSCRIVAPSQNAAKRRWLRLLMIGRLFPQPRPNNALDRIRPRSVCSGCGLHPISEGGKCSRFRTGLAGIPAVVFEVWRALSCPRFGPMGADFSAIPVVPAIHSLYTKSSETDPGQHKLWPLSQVSPVDGFSESDQIFRRCPGRAFCALGNKVLGGKFGIRPDR